MEKYTDQEFLYRQTPVNYDGIAKFTSIKGNTLGWNQLVQNGNFESTSGWKAANTNLGTISVSNNVLTYTIASQNDVPYNYRVQQQTDNNLSIPVGHKVYIAIDFNPSQANNGAVCLQTGVGALDGIVLNFSGAEVNKWTHLSTIYTIQNASQYIALWLRLNNPQTVGATFQFRNFMIIDLTQMGLDSLTVDEFTSLFPLPYYDYNQGTLIPFSGNGIKTVGFNQWDEEWEVGSINSSGNNYSSASAIRSKNYIPIIPNTAYCVNGNGGVMKVIFYDGNKNFISAPSWNSSNPFNVFTSPTNACYMRFATADGYGATYKNDICINISSSRNGEYEPYTSTTTSLPISTYFPTGMKSAGSVYDELTENEAITRIGSVDLGTLDWSYNSNGFMYSGGIIDLIAKPSASTVMANIVSTIQPSTAYTIYEGGNGIGIHINGQIRVRIDNMSTDPVTFKSSMSNVYLYYELATETETEIDAEIFYPFYGDGTEQILPVNGSTPATAPIIADIVYYTKIDTNTPYRKFWLVNGNGDRWNLTEKELKSFLDSPQGLGFQKSIDVTRYGEMAYKNTETYNFPQLSGDILFYDTINATRYEKYNEFVRFLMVQPLTLYYQIPVSIYSGIADIYTLDCEVINLTKTESKTDRMLTCPIQIAGLEFFNGEEVEIQGTGGTFTIENNSDFAVGFEITIEGGVLTNPYFTISQNGEIYGEAKFVDSTYFSSVYVNSNDGEQDAILMRGSSVLPNPLSYQDLSIANGSIYVTFVKLARGVSELTVGAESGTIRNVNIKFKPKYRSV